MAYSIPRVQVVPEPDSQASFQVDGREKLRYHFSHWHPRPFFYPVIGPSGKTLTRMGHPSAPDHDHHRSLWFAHNDIEGNNFWAEGQTTRVRQRNWVHYQDGDDEAGVVVDLDWLDGHNVLLMNQRLITVLRPLPGDESLIEIQTTFTTNRNPLILNKTNFGFLAVRMAKSISHHFGGGELRSSEGGVGEPAIFAKPARWVDYSGPIADKAAEGITVLPHADNVDFPSCWHVRDDGWMSPAFNLRGERRLTPSAPLTLRYLLHVHGGPNRAAIADDWSKQFAATPPYETVKAPAPWRWRLQRAGAGKSK